MARSALARDLALALLASAVAAVPLGAQQGSGGEDAAPALPDADGSVLSPIRMTYATTVQVQGQTVELDQTRTVARSRHDGRDTWTVVEASQTSRGAGLDSLFLDRERLTPIRRSAAGQGRVELRYASDSITGSMTFAGSETPVEMALEAPVLSGGPGLEMALSALPIREGWSATIRTHSPQQQEVHTRTFTVTGQETVDAPAGEFDVWVVEAAPVGGSGQEATFWVRREAPHHVIRSVRSLPVAMGGGTAEKELTGLDDSTPAGEGGPRTDD